MLWVEIASICDRFKCLPNGSSVADQYPITMNKMMQALRALDKASEEDMDRLSKEKS